MDPSCRSVNDHASRTTSDPYEDDDTVITPPKGGTTKSSERLSVEKTLTFRFDPSSDQDGVHPATLHVHWMHKVQTKYGDAVQFFDNRNRPVITFDPLRTDPTSHVQQFQLLFDKRTTQSKSASIRSNDRIPDPRKVTSYIVHRIRTFLSLSKIKAAPSVMKLMKDQKICVNEHEGSTFLCG